MSSISKSEKTPGEIVTETVTVTGSAATTPRVRVAAADSEEASPKPHSPSARYVIKEELGSGGAGQVLSALDIETRRLVAIKIPRAHEVVHNDLATAHFLGEASITAQLEHPAIVPIYDMGRAEDGSPFYTMRLVDSRSLYDVLIDPQLRTEWSLTRVVSVLIQVARALAYAHARGVLHRDVKPANILIGSYGEVYLADWGIARIAKESSVSLTLENDTPEHREDAKTRLIGTPGYMAPETISSASDKIDHRADLFALGVILYEILTGKQPFRRVDSAATLLATYSDEPVRPTEIAPEAPLLLEDLCLTLLKKNPLERVGSAEDLALRLEEFLEGARDKRRRADEAHALCKRAESLLERHQALQNTALRLREEARVLLEAVQRWEPVEKKKPAWALEESARAGEREAGLVLADAIDHFTKAIGHDPASDDAHRGLASIYWSRAREAEADRRPAAAAYYEALVKEHDDGHYAAILTAHSYVSLRSNNAEVPLHVKAQRYLEKDRVLVLGDIIDLGLTPLASASLEPGSWLMTLSAESYRDIRYPLMLRRGEHHEAAIDLYREREIGEGFVYVPKGKTIIGGDDDANHSREHQEVHVPAFAIGMYPVTLREYCTFLNAIAATEAEKHAPRDLHHALKPNIERQGNVWTPVAAQEDVPVTLIDWFDAMAYCTWRSKQDGVSYRLPFEVEWSKAARGVDGRFYPWGDAFDPTFCKMRDSRPDLPQIEPVGTFGADSSPYGVRDMAGNARHWLADIYDCETGELRCVCGGLWSGDAETSRSASRSPRTSPLLRAPGLSFRLAHAL